MRHKTQKRQRKDDREGRGLGKAAEQQERLEITGERREKRRKEHHVGETHPGVCVLLSRQCFIQSWILFSQCHL